jgi:hypothetical protein
MSDEQRNNDSLTEDELASVNGEPLPDREQMSVIRGMDPYPMPAPIPEIQPVPPEQI